MATLLSLMTDIDLRPDRPEPNLPKVIRSSCRSVAIGFAAGIVSDPHLWRNTPRVEFLFGLFEPCA